MLESIGLSPEAAQTAIVASGMLAAAIGLAGAVVLFRSARGAPPRADLERIVADAPYDRLHNMIGRADK